MKITVVKDQSGKTIGTIEAPASASGPTITPVLEAGVKATELEVAQNYKENLKELYK
jgi:hypothetical protein